jgi:hypothetical protein
MPLDKKGKPVLYKPWRNTGAGSKKMFVYVKADTKKGYKKIGFGLKGMKDFTQHKDKKRRASYLARSGGIKDKNGNLTKNNKNSANYWARKVLWSA